MLYRTLGTTGLVVPGRSDEAGDRRVGVDVRLEGLMGR